MGWVEYGREKYDFADASQEIMRDNSDKTKNVKRLSKIGLGVRFTRLITLNSTGYSPACVELLLIACEYGQYQ